MSDDYRFTKYFVHHGNDIKSAKRALENKIQKEHPGAHNFYRLISRDFSYKKLFAEIYSYRCAYCGLHICTEQLASYQLDHIISIDVLKRRGKKANNRVENLAFACQSCNRYKGNTDLLEPEISSLNPDGEEIKKIFVRDEDFYIKIADGKNSSGVQKFYEDLLLGAQLKRVDFLLMNLHDLSKLYPQISELDSAFKKLLELRSFLPPKET